MYMKQISIVEFRAKMGQYLQELPIELISRGTVVAVIDKPAPTPTPEDDPRDTGFVPGLTKYSHMVTTLKRDEPPTELSKQAQSKRGFLKQ